MENEIEFKFQKLQAESKRLKAQAELWRHRVGEEWYRELCKHLKVAEILNPSQDEEYVLCAGQSPSGGWVKFSYVYLLYHKRWCISFSSCMKNVVKNEHLLEGALKLWWLNPSWDRKED